MLKKPFRYVLAGPCLGQGAAQGEEAVLADSELAGKKSGLFEHPEGCSFDVLDMWTGKSDVL